MGGSYFRSSILPVKKGLRRVLLTETDLSELGVLVETRLGTPVFPSTHSLGQTQSLVVIQVPFMDFILNELSEEI